MNGRGGVRRRPLRRPYLHAEPVPRWRMESATRAQLGDPGRLIMMWLTTHDPAWCDDNVTLGMISKRTGYGKATVSRAIARLEDARLIDVERGSSGAGIDRVHIVVDSERWLHGDEVDSWDVPDGECSAGGTLHVPLAEHECSAGGTTLRETEGEQVKESNTQPSAATADDAPSLLDDDCESDHDPSFDEFWKLYPVKRGKQAASKAWGRLSAPQRRSAVAALPSHIDYWSLAGKVRTFIPRAPYPQKWLGEHRWLDDLEVPVDDTPERESAATARKRRELEARQAFLARVAADPTPQSATAIPRVDGPSAPRSGAHGENSPESGQTGGRS